MATRLILTLSCPDRPGIVAAVSGFLAGRDCNILDSAQYGDASNGRFFMRVSFAPLGAGITAAGLRTEFAQLAGRFAMDWSIHDGAVKPRLLVLVSRFGHCLNDLLYRQRIGALGAEIAAIVSNHGDFETLAGQHGVPFHHWRVRPDTKLEQERRMLDLIDAQRIDLVVLARYMQVLSPDACARLEGRCINIHHSFLPSFKGAHPYRQAWQRGVKLIGATAHYVTASLDEGPIIGQDVARCDHAMSADELAAVGRDVEAVVLARAVKAHVERRVLINGARTVVFG